jgi:Domain of unknown function (DUF5134)
MPYPTWLAYFFAAVLMVVGAYCLGRLVAVTPLGKRSHVDVNAGHVLMAFAMVGMLVPRWNALPVGLWEVVFTVMALWFLARSARSVRVVATDHGVAALATTQGSHTRHYLIHSVMACAMLYMYWLGMPVTSVAGTSGGMSAMSGPPTGAGDPGLTFFLVVVLLASAVWQLDGIEKMVPARRMALAASVSASAVGATGAVGGAEPGGSQGRETLWANPQERPWLAPRLEVGCHVAMCVAMAYMLVLMV